MEIKIYSTLPSEAVHIRKTVFCEEQGFQEEFDTIDANATHLIMLDQGKPVAVCRFFKDAQTDTYVVGRMAVMKPYRGRQCGSKLLRKAEEQIRAAGGRAVHLHAQTQAAAFYRENGYEAYGEIEYEQDCPHVWMCKQLNPHPEEGTGA